MYKPCSKCFNVIDELNFKKHRAECDGELIDIDEPMIDIITKFWYNGIKTYFCCSGHLHRTAFAPYIVIDPVLTDKASQLKDQDMKYSEFVIEANSEHVTIRGNNNRIKRSIRLTVPDKLKIQNNFITFLYELLKLYINSYKEDEFNKYLTICNNILNSNITLIDTQLISAYATSCEYDPKLIIPYELEAFVIDTIDKFDLYGIGISDNRKDNTLMVKDLSKLSMRLRVANYYNQIKTKDNLLLLLKALTINLPNFCNNNLTEI